MSFQSFTPSSHGRDSGAASRQPAPSAAHRGTDERATRQRAEPVAIPRSTTAESQADGAA